MNNKYPYIFCMRFFPFTLITLCSFLFACAPNPPQDCQEVDWYELGRRDGSRGFETQNRREVKIVCEDSDASLSEALYHNGFDAGISQFCSPQSAYDMGVHNRPVNAEICPPLMQEDFNFNYANGRKSAELNLKKDELLTRLEKIDSALSDKRIDRMRRGLLKGEKLEIEAQRKALDDSLRAAGRPAPHPNQN